MIVESGSGAVQWDLKLNSRAESPGPATLSTADHRSAFLIWGEYQVAGNETVGSAAEWLLFSSLWARIGWSYPLFPAFTFASVCATNAAASCTGCGVADQSRLLEARRPLRVIWSILGPHSVHSSVPAGSWWWHQQLLLSSAWLRREKGSVNKVTGLPRALPWCGTVGEVRGCWLGTSEVAAVWPGASHDSTARSDLQWPREYLLSVPRQSLAASMHSSAV